MAVTVHTHESAGEGGVLGVNGFDTGTSSFTGTLTGSQTADIAMTAYCFFPMLASSQVMNITGHPTDAASPDSPRFTVAFAGTYYVDYKFINS